MTTCVLSLGSNMGDRHDYLTQAVAALTEYDEISIDRVSPIFETQAWGNTDQPAFLNIIVLGTTTLAPHDLLSACQLIEAKLGRVREEHWGPRTVDIDIISMAEMTMNSPTLALPHPYADQRAFVLVPWLAADSGAVLPGKGHVAALVANLDCAGVSLWSPWRQP